MLSIRNTADLEVGDVGFYTIAGRVGGIVSLGQWLIDAVALLRGRPTEGSWFTHAFIVIGKYEDESVDIIEAMPGGARVVHLTLAERCGPGYGWARVPLTDTQRLSISDLSEGYVGVPYSLLDYLSIALLHLGLPRALVAKRVTDSGHMICSQLVDNLLARVGMHLFADGRLPQDVTPGALFRRCGAVGEIVWW